MRPEWLVDAACFESRTGKDRLEMQSNSVIMLYYADFGGDSLASHLPPLKSRQE